MSLTKRALPENIDVTDPRDTGFYSQEEQDEAEIAQGWREFDIQKFTVAELQAEIDRKNSLPMEDVPF